MATETRISARTSSARRTSPARDTAQAVSQENVEMMEAAYDAIARKDLDAFLALSHPEIEFRSLIAEADGGAYRGHEGVREWWERVIQSLDVQPRPESIEGFRERGITCLRLAGSVGGVEVPQTMWRTEPPGVPGGHGAQPRGCGGGDDHGPCPEARLPAIGALARRSGSSDPYAFSTTFANNHFASLDGQRPDPSRSCGRDHEGHPLDPCGKLVVTSRDCSRALGSVKFRTGGD